MKTNLRLLYYGLAVWCMLLFSGNALAQITYSANFESDDDGWDTYLFNYSNVVPCEGTGSLRASLWSLLPEAEAISPAIGTSNGGEVTVTYSYKLLNYSLTTPTVPTENEEGWGAFGIFWSTSEEGPFTLLETVTPENHMESATCTTRSVSFFPPAGTTVYLAISAGLSNEVSDFYVYFDEVNANQVPPVACSGMPDASATVASSIFLCNGQSTTLSLNPVYTDSGLTIQWQSSADNTTFVNVPAGGTGTTYTATQTASTWYRAVITCTASGQSVNSTPVQVVSSGVACPCEVDFSTSEPITLVNFAGINNASSAALGGEGYQDFTGTAPGQVTAGQSYDITLKGNTNDDWEDGYENYFTIFIDWNHDGDFEDANETYEIDDYLIYSTGTDSEQVTGSIAVPANALPGLTYMRVVKNWYDAEDDDWPLAYGGACAGESTGYGEAEDYILNVTVPVVATPDWVNLQHPGTITIAQGGSETVYAQVWEGGVTNAPGQGAGITAWIGISPVGSNTNPNTWTTWVPATYNASSTSADNDEYMATIGASLAPGTYYYASRFQLNGGTYVYGGYAAPPAGGGIWDGTTNGSGVLIVTCATPAPAADAAQAFCTGATVADLDATGTVITWYAAATGGPALAPATALVNGATYHASITPAGGCESIARTPVTVTITTVATPVVTVVQPACGTPTGTIIVNSPLGADYTYQANNGGFQASATFTNLAPGTYTITAKNATDCTAFTSVVINPGPTVPAVPVVTVVQPTCAEPLGSVTVTAPTGADYTYNIEDGPFQASPVFNDLEPGSYTVTVQNTEGCIAFTSGIVVNAVPEAPLAPGGDQTQEIFVDAAGDATLADLVVDATGTVTWYATEEDAEEGENPLSLDTVLVSGTTYYATQTVDGCESLGYPVTATVTLGNGDFGIASFSYHPNPVKEVLTLSYDRNIAAIEIFTIVGQQVMIKTVNQNEAVIDMSQLATGTYLVKVMSDSASKIIKVVKQ
ncbi:GEVED domain-containing protein [uncultured Flavobacterium sp.]|uniref:GEVED domain-containing protein n=1 Tax=uncultured Flavobacterium sp. TaxID=165435 RepID=UPI0025D43CA6|nr:GEVED domain-containing protein [uncultured Flavobacterium sp.]